MAGRVGFGIGLWGSPGYAIAGGQDRGLFGDAYLGGQTGIRWWVTERLAVLPSLALSVTQQSVPDTTSPFGDVVEGRDNTSAGIAPAVQLAYAVYRGQSTRFLLSGGPSFGYSIQPNFTEVYPDGSPKPPTDEIHRLTFAVLAGFALEQFFTPRISVVAGVDAPIFAYNSLQIGEDDPITAVSADFNSTRLSASVFFYMD